MTTQTRTRLFVGLETSEENLEIAPEEVIDEIQNHVKAGTFYEGKGLWMGDLENSIIFECMNLEENIRPETGLRDLEALKERLEDKFDQDSVMVEQTEVEVRF